MEACSFRDALPRFEGINAVVLGVSADSTESHRKFRDKFKLPYHLVADTDKKIVNAYGVWGKKMTGMGIHRTTFVIGADGRIAHVFEKVKPDGHGQQVAEVVEKLDRPS